MSRSPAAALALLALAACSSRPAPDPAPAAAEEAPAAEDAPAADDPPAAATLLETRADLRGRGAERVHLDAGGVLHVGALSIPVEGIAASVGNRYHWDAQASLRAVDLAPDTRAVQLSFPTPEQEDPPNVLQLFVVANDRLIRVLDLTPGAYGVQLAIPGDGTVSYVEDGWTACDRLGHPETAARQRVTFALSDDGAAMRESRREDTGDAAICAELPACPFVYAVTDDGEVFVGEILRNLRGASAYALQPLSLPAASGSTVRLVLREEKPEVTYLDEIYLEVAGLRLRPRACGQGAAVPAYCDRDRPAHVLRQGDALPLAFDLPPGSDARAPRLWARGHYVPQPAATMD